jgi:hypothetical protein
MVGTQQGHENQPESKLKSNFKYINHVRVQTALDREHGCYNSFTFRTGCTLSPQVV